MLMRSTIITSVYKKGLRLSNSSRQTHGTGQIANHMAVDTQQLSDMMMQFHPVWLMPLQVTAALALIYSYIGLSSISAFLGSAGVLLFTTFRSKSSNGFQFQIMTSRDLGLLEVQIIKEATGALRRHGDHGLKLFTKWPGCLPTLLRKWR